MNQDYTVQFLKLAGKCFAWVAGLGLLGGFIAAGVVHQSDSSYWLMLICSLGACFYAAIPIFIFTAFIIVCRAFGRN